MTGGSNRQMCALARAPGPAVNLCAPRGSVAKRNEEDQFAG
jgi:hypothetical protein